ncbi:auxilin-like clathrin-binding protein required for normal clathrin function [Saxophila tyrrhenica]|uniref:Auxilin-like clathrin-binding protein required for normal clathrin function n=1 Tax=Saxophila tyrrhenica TaxID=1690608 RepID=A0AAV9P074_9PEZI|nr:auxilin-like clathrin-binding protein required for normal clathrin function [Saxophila tyrrhenica]
MDDLLGEDWRNKPSVPPTPYSGYRPAQLPGSGTASPANLSRPSSAANVPKPTTPANHDSFGNLLGPKTQRPTTNVSMQERQKQLIEERRRQQEQSSQLWETLGSGRSTPAQRQPSPAAPVEDDDDILAAFNKDAPVDAASHLSPPPSSAGASGRNTPAFAQQSMPTRSAPSAAVEGDDDLFGLGSVRSPSNGHATAPKPEATNEDDDILGDLGKPVTPIPQTQSQAPDESSQEHMLGSDRRRPSNEPEHEQDELAAAPKDRALAELVDMGFPVDTARIALSETGGNVQGAVGWLLQQAHEESRQKARGETPASRTRSPQVSSRSPQRRQRDERADTPAWMRSQDGGRSNSAARQREGVNGDKDAAHVAQELGSKVWKSANSLWKASQKQMARTIAELQQEPGGGDTSQPKWMRDPNVESDPPRRRQPNAPAPKPRTFAAGLTDEAAALDGPRENSERMKRPSPPSHPSSRGRSPAEALPTRPARPNLAQPTATPSDRRPAMKLSRQAVEEQTAQAYVSPARRKRPTAQPPPEPEQKADKDVDLFSSESVPPAAKVPPNATSSARPVPASRPSPAPIPQRPKAPQRTVPAVSPTALQAAATHRKTGGEHFKRGDYAAAHESYTAALMPLPTGHPITIVILSNRSLTALKTGDAKVAVSDAERALEVIGPSQGTGESIELGVGEGVKEMKEFYGKALMRKAEALEHMEKYNDAAAVWRQAVEAGVGGTVSLRGRDRCEKAAAPKPPAAAKPTAPTRTSAAKVPTKSLGNTQQRPTLSSASSADAVKKLRAANAQANREEDEKFALGDSVDAKLTAWKGGKSDNLRALLQSMDLVLWPEAGWKKVGMSDLVMPARVKIVYMKAIGKVHPDKIPQDATTEQRMVSAAVFSTLNEAWDKFKTENKL